MDKNTLKSILQSVASNFSADRDDAISKLNRLLDSPYDPNIDLETLLTQYFKDWALADLSLAKVSEAAQQMQNQIVATQQSKAAEQHHNQTSRDMPSEYPDADA